MQKEMHGRDGSGVRPWRKWRRTIGESSEDDDGEYGLNGADGEDEDAIVETHFALLCVLLYNTGVAVRTLFGGFWLDTINMLGPTLSTDEGLEFEAEYEDLRRLKGEVFF